MTDYTQIPTIVRRHQASTYIDIEGTRNDNPLRLEVETIHDRERKVFISRLIRQECEISNGRVTQVRFDLGADMFKLRWGHVDRYSDTALREFHLEVLGDMERYKTLDPVQRLFESGDTPESIAEAAGGDELYEQSRAARHAAYRQA